MPLMIITTSNFAILENNTVTHTHTQLLLACIKFGQYSTAFVSFAISLIVNLAPKLSYDAFYNESS